MRSNRSSPVNLDVGAALSEEGEPSLEEEDDQWAEDSVNGRPGSRASSATGSEEMEDAGEPGAPLDGADSEAESRSCLGAGLW